MTASMAERLCEDKNFLRALVGHHNIFRKGKNNVKS